MRGSGHGSWQDLAYLKNKRDDDEDVVAVLPCGWQCFPVSSLMRFWRQLVTAVGGPVPAAGRAALGRCVLRAFQAGTCGVLTTTGEAGGSLPPYLSEKIEALSWHFSCQIHVPALCHPKAQEYETLHFLACKQSSGHCTEEFLSPAPVNRRIPCAWVASCCWERKAPV